jgi:ABC-type nitrate/sulfonate/bicarbonate transport system ATPase subunit
MTFGDTLLQFSDVSLSYGAVSVLQHLDLQVRAGEFVAIVGPSGCGKTTILNLCSGWLMPTEGDVRRHGRSRTVFQQDGLFPWLTVGENVMLGLQHLAADADRTRGVARWLGLVDLAPFEKHYPHQLSGGMRQRAELVRALAGETDLLLMDEPFSSLDYLTRLRLRNELARLLAEQPRTVVLVTHDIEEAAQLADRVVVLSERPATIREEVRIEQLRPRDLTHPSVIRAVHRILAGLGLESDDVASAAGQARGRQG